MNRITTGLLAATLLLAGCNGVSRVDATADVTISGAVQRDDGTPADDMPVAMARELGPAEAFEAMFTVFSFGTLCLVPDPPDICRERGAVTRTGPDGRFTLEVSGRDTQSFFGFASTLAVSTALPPPGDAAAGPTTTLRFAAQSERVELPELRVWEAIPAVEHRDGTITTTWPSPPAWLTPDAGLTLSFEGPAGAQVWTQPIAQGPATTDARVLEDLATGVVVQAERTLTAANLTTDAAYRTAQARVQGAGAPPSRAAPCTLHHDGGTLAVSPCPLTDGDLGTAMEPRPHEPGEPPSPPPAPGEARSEAVVVDLGAIAERSLVVLRGLPSGFTVELSADGAKWTAPVQVQARTGVAAVPVGPVAARYVRVSHDPGMTTHLVEVSVW